MTTALIEKASSGYYFSHCYATVYMRICHKRKYVHLPTYVLFMYCTAAAAAAVVTVIQCHCK